MTMDLETTATRRDARERRWSGERGAMALGTLLVWAHVVDEVRIGEYIAVPTAVATAALLAGWPRLRPAWRGAGALLLALMWVLGAVMYHVSPLLQGAVTWQNLSGLLQLAGGLVLGAVGVRALLTSALQRRAALPGRY